MRQIPLSRPAALLFRALIATVASITLCYAATYLLARRSERTRAVVSGVASYAMDRSACGVSASIEAAIAPARLDEAATRIQKTAYMAETDAGFERWHTDHGAYWVPAGDAPTLFYLLAEEDRNLYTGMHLGDTVLDCGAHWGLVSRRLLNAGAGRIVAIEPAPLAIECLRRNLSEEIASGKVIVVPKGVWDRPDVLPMNLHKHLTAMASFVMWPEWKGHRAEHYEAPLVTIDSIVEDLGLARVDFIKMDIEGAEQKALAGARNTLVRFRPRMAIAVYHSADDAVQIPRIVAAIRHGYSIESEGCTQRDTGEIRHEIAHFR